MDIAIQMGLNHPMGPFSLMDLIGLDTTLSILEVLHGNLGDPKYCPAPLLRQYVAAGWLGRKTGRGFYHYPPPAQTPGAIRTEPASRATPLPRALVAREGAIAVVSVNRPEARNALDGETLDALHDAFAALEREAGIRCAILTGAGDKAFAAGADIKAMSNADPAGADRLVAHAHRLGELLEGSRLPVIAAVNGFALGGGFELALACDFIFAARGAKVGMPEVGLGVIPGMGGTQRLVQRVGVARARELVYTGALIDADAAARIGLVNEVTEPAKPAAGPGRRRRDRHPRAAGRRRRQAGPPPRPRPAARRRDRPRTRALLRPLRHPRSKGGDARLSRKARPCLDRTMNFDLSPEQKMIRDSARELATREIAPQAAEIDRTHTFPHKIFARLGEIGLLGIMLPEKWGGAGMDALSYAVALEEIARACASTAVRDVGAEPLCGPHLQRGPMPAARWLPDPSAGQKIGCFALSEPEAGSDAKAQRTRAIRDGTSCAGS